MSLTNRRLIQAKFATPTLSNTTRQERESQIQNKTTLKIRIEIRIVMPIRVVVIRPVHRVIHWHQTKLKCTWEDLKS